MYYLNQLDYYASIIKKNRERGRGLEVAPIFLSYVFIPFIMSYIFCLNNDLESQ